MRTAFSNAVETCGHTVGRSSHGRLYQHVLQPKRSGARL